MKIAYLFLMFSLSIFIACDKDDFFDEIPQSDLIALEGMGEALEHAELYNDSLSLCGTELTCDEDLIAHYDNEFHHFDGLFSEHHNNYSHNNIGDDHHHDGDRNIRHGWMMNDHDDEEHDDDEEEDEDEHEFGHDLDSYKMMLELREIHESVHPD